MDRWGLGRRVCFLGLDQSIWWFDLFLSVVGRQLVLLLWLVSADEALARRRCLLIPFPKF